MNQRRCRPPRVPARMSIRPVNPAWVRRTVSMISVSLRLAAGSGVAGREVRNCRARAGSRAGRIGPLQRAAVEVGRETECEYAITVAILNGGRPRARTPVPVIGNAVSSPARRTKSKPSGRTGTISACIMFAEDGHGSLSEQPTRPFGFTLWPRHNRTEASKTSSPGMNFPP